MGKYGEVRMEQGDLREEDGKLENLTDGMTVFESATILRQNTILRKCDFYIIFYFSTKLPLKLLLP
jgi:hypothetical protein